MRTGVVGKTPPCLFHKDCLYLSSKDVILYDSFVINIKRDAVMVSLLFLIIYYYICTA